MYEYVEILEEIGKVETTVRRFDNDGKLLSETITIVTEMVPKEEKVNVGMYL